MAHCAVSTTGQRPGLHGVATVHFDDEATRRSCPQGYLKTRPRHAFELPKRVGCVVQVQKTRRMHEHHHQSSHIGRGCGLLVRRLFDLARHRSAFAQPSLPASRHSRRATAQQHQPRLQVHLLDRHLQLRALGQPCGVVQAREQQSPERADHRQHHRELQQRSTACAFQLRPPKLARPRSQMGRNTPMARTSTSTPRNTMRMGSIC